MMKLPVDDFSASFGLPMTPKIRFLNQKIKSKTVPEESLPHEPEDAVGKSELKVSTRTLLVNDSKQDEENDLLLTDDDVDEAQPKANELEDVMYVLLFILETCYQKIVFALFSVGIVIV